MRMQELKQIVSKGSRLPVSDSDRIYRHLQSRCQELACPWFIKKHCNLLLENNGIPVCLDRLRRRSAALLTGHHSDSRCLLRKSIESTPERKKNERD